MLEYKRTMVCVEATSGRKYRNIFLMEENPQGDLTINDLNLAAYVPHLHIFEPPMKPLEQISTKVDITSAEGW